MEQFDFIIIGAGSAGCVLADRLSADGKSRVLLLESGPKDRTPWIHVPLGYGMLFHSRKYNYGFEAEGQNGLNDRVQYWPRGRVVGGSGAINAMVYCRGMRKDFDDWEQAGATGWGWDTVRASYDAIETHVAPDGQTRGDGPIHVSDIRDQIHPVNRHYFEALNECQLPQTDDMNAPDAEGGGIYRLNTQNGRRCASSHAFLKSALRRRNLVLRTGATVEKVLLEEGRATGVLLHWRGRTRKIMAGEVILSAGAVHSPLILQRSGIGPGNVLSEHGITTLIDNANVGGNLQDHLGVNYGFKAAEPTMNNVLRPWYGKVMAGLRYILTRKGPLSLSVNQCGGFFRSSAHLQSPDQQLYFNPITYKIIKVGGKSIIKPDPFSGFILGMQPCRPTSRGRVDISGADPAAGPRIRPNSLATAEDQQQVIAGGRLCAKIMNAPSLKSLTTGAIDDDIRTMKDDAILADFRERCGTVFHPVSTCRMGRDPENSVTDPYLKVHGVKNLRVVDASAFPNVTSGNTNAPTMMLANRAADLILNIAS